MVLYMCNMHMTEQSNNYGWQLSEQHTSWAHTTFSKYKSALAFILLYIYIKNCLIAAISYKEAQKHNKAVRDLENEFAVAFKPPTAGALIHSEGSSHAWPSLLVALILQVNCNVFLLFFFLLFFILRFTWKQLITLKNKLKWWWH